MQVEDIYFYSDVSPQECKAVMAAESKEYLNNVSSQRSAATEL